MNFDQKVRWYDGMYITCNKSFLFASKLKTLKKKGNNKYHCETRFFWMLLKWKTLIHSIPIWNWNPFIIFEFNL